MNSDSESDEFEAVRKLIALKRHEQPPPGYFNLLPERIEARLERGDGQLRIWDRLMEHFTFRPAFVYGFSLAALGALTVSVVYSIRLQPEESGQTPPDNGWRSGTPEEPLASQYNPSQPLHVASWVGDVNASNPTPSMPSLFGPAAPHPTVPVSFASPP